MDRGSRGLITLCLTANWYDTGNKLDYLKAGMEFGLQRPEFQLELQKYILEKATELSRH